MRIRFLLLLFFVVTRYAPAQNGGEVLSFSVVDDGECAFYIGWL